MNKMTSQMTWVPTKKSMRTEAFLLKQFLVLGIPSSIRAMVEMVGSLFTADVALVGPYGPPMGIDN